MYGPQRNMTEKSEKAKKTLFTYQIRGATGPVLGPPRHGGEELKFLGMENILRTNVNGESFKGELQRFFFSAVGGFEPGRTGFVHFCEGPRGSGSGPGRPACALLESFASQNEIGGSIRNVDSSFYSNLTVVHA